jgi:hypothetical protein
MEGVMDDGVLDVETISAADIVGEMDANNTPLVQDHKHLEYIVQALLFLTYVD